jgi:hypothetical protein
MKTEKTEEVKVNGKDLLSKIKELIKEGNVKKLTIKDCNDKTLVRIPVNAGLLFLVLAPFTVILMSLATYLVDYTIVIEKK